MIRVDFHEVFLHLSSTIINLAQMRASLVESSSISHQLSRKISACSKSMRAHEALFTQVIFVAQLDAIFAVFLVPSTFKYVRNFGDIAAPKSQVVYRRDFEVATKNFIHLRDKNRL